MIQDSVSRPKKVYRNWLHNLPHTLHETEALYNQLEKDSWGPEMESGIQHPPNKRVHGKVFLWQLQVIWSWGASQLFWATWMMFKPKKLTSLEHQAQQNRVLEDPISGGHQEPVTEEPWFKRRCETWREGQRSRLPKEPGPIGTSAKGSPLGGCCGDWSHVHMSSLLRSVNDTLNFSKLVQVGTGKGPIVQISWAHILSGVQQYSPKEGTGCAMSSWHPPTPWCRRDRKAPTTSENITSVCEGRGKLQLQREPVCYTRPNHGTWRSTGEEGCRLSRQPRGWILF